MTTNWRVPFKGGTMCPSGKWVSFYSEVTKIHFLNFIPCTLSLSLFAASTTLLRIGVFDSREKAALGNEISREFLKADKGSEPVTQEDTDRNERSFH